MKPRKTATLLLSLFCTMAVSAVHASDFVKGRIYLKDGSVVECGDRDRIRLPKRTRPVKLFRNAYRKEQEKELFSQEMVDSIVCWHPAAADHARKFVFAGKPGCMWVYFESPNIRACVYASKRYGVDSNGGIEVLVQQRYFSRSRSAYYLRKAGDDGYFCVGSASRKAGKRFRRLVAGYIADDPDLAGAVLSSRTSNRSKVILMLGEYVPGRD